MADKPTATAKPTAPAAPAADEFGAAPQLGTENPKAARGPKNREPNPLYDRVKACALGKGPMVKGHWDGVMVPGTIGKDAKNKITLTGRAARAAALVRRAAADGHWKHSLRPLGPGSHQVGDVTISVPDGQVAIYWGAFTRDATDETPAATE